MRAITKPDPPQLATPSYAEYARALGNAPGVGRFCSFCEKALTYQLLLFHKQRGALGTSAQLGNDDWGDLLLACGDCCAASADSFNPQTAYFWPDTADAQHLPYLYNLADNATITVKNPDGVDMPQTTASVVLVSVSADVPAPIQAAAQNTYQLFRLNGRYFNDNAQQPGYDLPYAEYAHPTDARLDLRWDAYVRASAAAGALARGIPTIPFEPAYVQNMLVMIGQAVDGFGFLSTWQSAIASGLDAIDTALLPQLLALMAGQLPPMQPPPDTDRKRKSRELEEGIQQADQAVSSKRSKLEMSLGKAITAQS
jgi:hypothetical protein